MRIGEEVGWDETLGLKQSESISRCGGLPAYGNGTLGLQFSDVWPGVPSDPNAHACMQTFRDSDGNVSGAAAQCPTPSRLRLKPCPVSRTMIAQSHEQRLEASHFAGNRSLSGLDAEWTPCRRRFRGGFIFSV